MLRTVHIKNQTEIRQLFPESIWVGRDQHGHLYYRWLRQWHILWASTWNLWEWNPATIWLRQIMQLLQAAEQVNSAHMCVLQSVFRTVYILLLSLCCCCRSFWCASSKYKFMLNLINFFLLLLKFLLKLLH
jgi:hypothetical protein